MRAERLTIAQFQAAIWERRFLAGDGVLYRWGRQSPLAWAIARAQRRALEDLLLKGMAVTAGPEGEQVAAWIAEAAAYTHAGMVLDAARSVEMTSPHARVIGWERRLRVGDRLLIVRPGLADGWYREAKQPAVRSTPRTPTSMGTAAGMGEYTHTAAAPGGWASTPLSPSAGPATAAGGDATAPSAPLTSSGVSAAGRRDEGSGEPRRPGGGAGAEPLREELFAAAVEMVELATDREDHGRYPWRELLTYWFATLPNAIAADHFAEYFRNRDRNVCSGAMWQAWVNADCFSVSAGATPADDTSRTQYPEAWYPARMAVDEVYLRRVAEIEIVAEVAEGTDATEKGDGEMKASVRREWADAVPGLILLLSAALLLVALCAGCRGGLLGGAGAEAGRPTIKVYEVHFATGANSIANIGNAGTQSPMYQSPETATEKDGAGPYFTGGTMPASGGTNAGTAQGKYVQQNVNDSNKRSAESDISAAAQLLAGNTQSTGTQTPAQVQRQGTATPTSTTTANPEHNPALQVNPATALTGQGTAQVTNPTSTLVGASSQPGAVTGGTGLADGGYRDAALPGVSSTTPSATPPAAAAASPGGITAPVPGASGQ